MRFESIGSKSCIARRWVIYIPVPPIKVPIFPRPGPPIVVT
jgi:hypothetical protein